MRILMNLSFWYVVISMQNDMRGCMIFPISSSAFVSILENVFILGILI